ncbi:conserved hypothetical protein [Limnospira maxima CS-328]|uniref:Uncharacterized protein n=1 Tax=Limnospira maxima CS-328 TaxID=513049 RepID=B5VUY3_LIMMA|nr:hypothetical protein [Limnospira maxima]EDZ96828.1 conserved hypothetical protein [Limnospira maxima CS-328]MDC0836659.1 hypothetical protein [Limnoraphis robusta]
MATPQFEHSSQPALEASASSDVVVSSDAGMIAETSQPIVYPKKRGKRPGVPKGFWGWQLLWLFFLLGFGTTATGALLWLLTTPPPPNCEEISAISAAGDRLHCADQSTKSGKLEDIQAAFALVNSWPEDHPLQNQGRQMMREWSQRLIFFANQRLEAGDLQGALDLVAVVPADSPAYEEVQRAMASWQNYWDEGLNLARQAENAMKSQDWNQAFRYIQAVGKLNNVHWNTKRFNELLDRLSLERQGEQRLKEAANIAKRSTPESLVEAIELANKVDEQLFIVSLAKKEITSWSQKLLELAVSATEKQDFDQGIKIARMVPSYSPVHREAKDIILLTELQQVISNQSLGQPLLQMATLIEGQAALERIPSDRLLYQETKAMVDDASAKIQDLVGIQLASTIAKVNHPWALQLAIDQAQMIAPERPRRLQAQTLVAHWRNEVQRIQDRPYILIAREAARTETVDGFRTAVAYAENVALGRPLRIEAQTLIAEWTKRIQIIEDQPIFSEALALAQDHKLSEAVKKASEIGRGRALYNDAQEKIAAWVTTIQTAEDQPILDSAYSLASRGRLTAAINEASKIGSGRALYFEARNAIARWSAERNAIWASQRAAEESYRAPARQSYDNSRSYESSYSDNWSSNEPSYSDNWSSNEPSYSNNWDSYSSGYSDNWGSNESSYSNNWDSYSSGYSDYVAPAPAPAYEPAPAPAYEPAPAPAISGDYSAPDSNFFLE